LLEAQIFEAQGIVTKVYIFAYFEPDIFAKRSSPGTALGQGGKELRAMQTHKNRFQIRMFLFSNDVDLKKM